MASYALVQVRWNRARPSGQPAEDVAVNTIHFQAADGGLTTGDRDTVRDALDAWYTAIKASISSLCGPTEYRFYNLPAVAGPSGDPAFTDTNTARVGTGSSSAELAAQVAMSITWQTAIRRRWGRIYVPCLVNGVMDTGRFSTTALSTFGAATDALGTTMRDGGNGIVVWHRATWTPEDVTTFDIDDVPDVIRRRRFGQKFNVHTGSFTS